MSQLLSWRPSRRDDRDHLKVFTCTQQATKVRRGGRWEHLHPALWEVRVQSLIRHNLPPVGEHGRTTLLGFDGDTLAAVVSYREIEGPQVTKVDVVAVACEYRGRGGGWANEAVDQTLDLMTTEAHAHGYDLIAVTADVHERNRPSQRLLRTNGFTQTEQRADGYQVWSQRILVAGGLFDDFS